MACVSKTLEGGLLGVKCSLAACLDQALGASKRGSLIGPSLGPLELRLMLGGVERMGRRVGPI